MSTVPALPSFGRGLTALFIGATGIGLAPLFVRWSEVGLNATGFWRLTLALPFFLIWSLFHPGERKPLPRSDWIFLILAGVFFGGDLALWHAAIHLTFVANATLETNLSAILVPLFAWIFLRQHLGGLFRTALVLTLFGVVLLVGKNAHINAHTLDGDALGTISAFFYSGYLLSVKAARDGGSATATIMIVSGIITAAVLAIIASVTGEPFLPVTPHGWTIVIGLALVSQIGGQCLIAYSLVALPASFASLGLLVQPAAATIAAWLFLGESLGFGQILGALVLVLGLWLARRSVQP